MDSWIARAVWSQPPPGLAGAMTYMLSMACPCAAVASSDVNAAAAARRVKFVLRVILPSSLPSPSFRAPACMPRSRRLYQASRHAASIPLGSRFPRPGARSPSIDAGPLPCLQFAPCWIC